MKKPIKLSLTLLATTLLFVDIPEALKNALLQIRNKGEK